MSGGDKNDYLVEINGKEQIHFDDAAMQIIQGHLGIRGILRGSKPPRPRFLVQLLNALRELSGMIEGTDFQGQVISKAHFNEKLEELEQVLQLCIHEEQQRASTRLATVGWVLSGVGILLGALQLFSGFSLGSIAAWIGCT